jgi:drug/metabolite transporter (DMT)-like permease
MNAYSGVGLRLLAAFLITAMSALVHGLAQTVPVGQIIFFRSAVALIPIVAYMALRGQLPGALATSRSGLHVTRSLFGTLSMAFSFVSLAYLPVANAQALGYLAPVLTLPLAALMLRERMTPAIIGAVALGFGGVIAMLWHAFDVPGNGALIGVGAGLGYAVTMAFVRVHIKAMTATENPATIAFYFALTASVAGLATLPFGWATIDLQSLLWLCGAGLLGGLAHIAATEAVARAPVGVLAPFDFTGLVWALGFDLVLFSVFPDTLGLLGAAAITGAALIVTFASARPAARGADLRGR